MASQKTKEILRRSYVACLEELKKDRDQKLAEYNHAILIIARKLDELNKEPDH